MKTEHYFDRFMGYGSGVVDSDYRTLRYMLRRCNFPTGQYMEYWKGIVEQLQSVFRTRMSVLPMMGSIRIAFDSAANLLEPGDKVVVLSNGYWGAYPARIVKRYGANCVLYEGPVDRPITGEDAEKALAGHQDAKMVIVLHVETDTGIANRIEDIGQVVRTNTNALFVVDGASAAGATDIDLSKWRPDLFFTGSHKGMNGPGGLAIMFVGDKIWEAARKCKAEHRSYYTDLTTWRDEWLDPVEDICYPSVPASIMHALKSRLDLLVEDGPDKVFARHAKAAKAIRLGVRGMGLQTVADCSTCPGCDSPRRYCSDAVTVFRYPEKVSHRWMELEPMMARYHFVADTPTFGVGGGRELGFRIGHLADYQILPRNFISLVTCLGLVFQELGADVDIAKGLNEMNQVVLGQGVKL